MTRSSKIDWSPVRIEYEAGRASNRKLAARFGVSEGALRKQAKAGGWVRTKGKTAYHKPRSVNAAAPPDISLVESSRSAPGEIAEDARDVAARMLGELHATTSHLDQVEDLIYEETQGDANGRRRQAMLKAVSLGARTLALKNIVQATAAISEIGGKSKKEDQADAALRAANKFATPIGPKLISDNTKK